MAPTEQLRQRTRGGVGNRDADPTLRDRAVRGPDGKVSADLVQPAQKHIFWASYFGWMLDRFGRRGTLAMADGLHGSRTAAVFLWAFQSGDLTLFLVLLVLLGVGGADFAVFSLWLPEVYPTEARAGGFAFVTTVGRLVGAGLTFAIGAMNDAIGLGKSLSLTAIFFVIGLLLLPLAREGRRRLAPE